MGNFTLSTMPFLTDLEKYALIYGGLVADQAKQGYDSIDYQIDKFFDLWSENEGSHIQLQETHGIGNAEQVKEMQLPSLQSPGQGYNKIYAYLDYAVGMRISSNALRDNNKSSMYTNMAEYMGVAAKYSQGKSCWDFLNTHASQTTPDGVALFSTSHTIAKNGATYTNRPSGAGIALSEVALNDLAIEAAKSQDASNRKAKLYFTSIAYPVDMRFTAQRLFKTQKEIVGNGNVINTAFGSNIVTGNFVECEFLTDSTVFFLRTNLKGLVKIEREALNFPAIERGPGGRYFTQYGFYSQVLGCYDPRSVWAGGTGLG